jgi:DNA-binding NarL/FixJ family response regulator
MGSVPHTVQAHLKSIFAKTSANSRQALLTTASGTGHHQPIGSAISSVGAH